MTSPRTTVFIIDDEASIRTALVRLCHSAGFVGRSFESVEDFLTANLADEGACVVADIRMPGDSGLGLPSRLRALSRKLPVIFMTAFDTPKTRAEARLAGAAGYFRKPVDDRALLDAIEWSLGQDSIPTEL